MLTYISESDYETLMGTESVPDNFDKLNKEASAYINRHTSGRIDENNPSESVKYTTCLLIDLIKDEKEKTDEVSNIKSENVDGWSRTYSSIDDVQKSYEIKKEDILKTYLIDEIGIDGLPLLYRGMR